MNLLLERFISLLPHQEAKKKEHADEVWNMLQSAYSKIGGIHGSGFSSKEDMIKNIPMWKVGKENGKLTSVSLYKDKAGRKRVAVATNGTQKGKEHLAHMMVSDVKRGGSYGEISGPSLSFLKKSYPDFHKHVINHAEAKQLMPGDQLRRPPDNDPEVIKHPELKDHFYQRQIGGMWHTKVMLGKAGNTLFKK